VRRPIDDVQYSRGRAARRALLDVLSPKTQTIVTHIGKTSWPIDSDTTADTPTTDFIGDLTKAANETIELFAAVANVDIGWGVVQDITFDDLVSVDIAVLGDSQFHEVVSERSYRRCFPDNPIDRYGLHKFQTYFGPIRNLQALMKDAPFRWCVAGGWALDTFLQNVTRKHQDVDVVLFRNDASAIQSFFVERGWDIELIENGRFRDWINGEPLPDSVTQLHIDHPGNDIGHVDVLLTPSTPNSPDWVFRRDTRITRRIEDAITNDALAPELVLLYKVATNGEPIRNKDADDFALAAPMLSVSQCDWLREAIAVFAPGHPWLEVLV
jgi:Aminoglycoside-2''-adenylyltransferase